MLLSDICIVWRAFSLAVLELLTPARLDKIVTVAMSCLYASLTRTTYCIVLYCSLLLLLSDICIVWRAFSLAVLEPLTPARLDKIVTVAMSCLYASLTCTTYCIVLYYSLQLLLSDICIVWRAFSLAVLEPLTPARLDKIVTFAMSCLYASLTCTTYCIVLYYSLQLLLSDICIVWRAFSLAVLEPLTPARLDKIVTVAMSCLYASLTCTTYCIVL